MDNDIETIVLELRAIQDFLESSYGDTPDEIIERGKYLENYMARSSKLLADSKYLANTNKKDNNAKFIVDWAERLNKSCGRSLDFVRSRLSYEKELLKNTNFQT